jgi:hypothetical protein
MEVPGPKSSLFRRLFLRHVIPGMVAWFLANEVWFCGVNAVTVSGGTHVGTHVIMATASISTIISGISRVVFSVSEKCFVTVLLLLLVYCY